jgi:lipoprotein NlpI
MVVTAELEGGRLNAKMRADALRRRGISLDQAGQFEVARADFEEAMRLMPDDDEVVSAAAANALLVGSAQRALELGDKALQLSPSSSGPRSTLALANYAMGNYVQAKQQRLELLKNSTEVERSYSAIWLYLAARRLGEDAVAAVQPYLPGEASPAWPNPVLQLLLGKGSYEQAYKAAIENPRDPSRLCELYYYIGEKYLIEGDTRRAREYLEKSLDTKVMEYNEYIMAKRGLDALAGNAGRQ